MFWTVGRKNITEERTCAVNTKKLWHLLNGDSGCSNNEYNHSNCSSHKINANYALPSSWNV